MMKIISRILLFIILLIGLATNAQEISLDTLVKNMKQDFAIPDLPAFNALQTEPDNLLRPSTSKDFSIIADQFYDGTHLIIPKSIAIEFAPIMLLKSNNLTLRDYQKSPAWYNFRVSLGSLRDSLNVSKVALGFRTTIINQGDIKSDKNLVIVSDYLRRKNDARVAFNRNELKLMGYPRDSLNSPVVKDSLKARFDRYWFSKNDSLQKVIRDYIDCKNWNAEKLDVALALVGSSPDSLAQNIGFNSLRGWITYAHPIGQNAQIMLGGNFNLLRQNDSTHFALSIPVRIYAGSNQIKGYAECQYSYLGITKASNLLFNLGCEYDIGKGFWLNYTIGYENNLTVNSSKLVSKFKIIYAIPGNLGL